MSPEFSRTVSLDSIGVAGLDYTVTAKPDECAAIAARMDLPAIASLICRFRLRSAPGGGVDAAGVLAASVTQTCVVTLDEFPTEVAESFTIRFVPAELKSIDVDPDSVDEIPFTGTTLDLGEAAAEQLALALPPYPRKPSIDGPAADSPNTEPSAPKNPFSELAFLRPAPRQKK